MNLLVWIIYYQCVSGKSLVWAFAAQEGREEQEESLPPELVGHEYLLQAGSKRPPQGQLAAVSEHSCP